MAYYPFATEIGATYRLVGPNGAVAVFNDPSDPNYVGMLSELTGLDSPEIRESAEDLVESDGGTHGNFYLGRRPITINGRVFGHATLAERTIRLDRARRATMALRGDATLSWKPSRRVENFATNPSGEIDNSGYTSSTGGIAATIARSTARASQGAASLLVTAANSSGASQLAGAMTTLTPFNPNDPVAARVDFYNTGTANEIRMRPKFYAADGTTVVQNGVEVASTTKNAWTTLSGTWTAPAGTAYVRLEVYGFSSATGQTYNFWFDGVVYTKSTAVPAYFDGDTAGMHWQGGQGVTASGDYIEMFTYVRRQQPFRETGAWNKEFQIQLVSEYAALYSVQQITKLAASGSPVTCENRGSWPAYPIIRIAGTSTNPQVTNSSVTPNAVLRTTGLTLASGELIEIDTFNHTAAFTAGARSGQSGNRYIDWGLTAVWPYLATGNNSLTLTGGGTLAVLWRDTWA